ncbi:Acetyltransferase (GNAT) family protein [Polynucleobacter meluiroseus]|uniref:Acetyltransferase (GNAT) family protein n=1 Tax=Polynucleobacter meluiroseus TaxID=1938814 RepID=A0A240DXI4_9BURK|nr:GNAT family N-acetyltransferase [Polynucleobacter meluiroseus]SNX27905.1 Acetyltransferase (GNAT) family protein [Polynucleobacter meluiroseus]
MLTTTFLSKDQILEYGTWLKAQDPQTLHNYFGCAIGPESIDTLVQKFSKDPKRNHFLIAKIDGQWAGTIHIATHSKEVEFGVIVAAQYRKQGIANVMMDEAITWARNRFYTDLFMHCISWNLPIKHLCKKHGLTPRNMMGDSEANLQLQPPSPASFLKEQAIAQRNWMALFQVPRLSLKHN